MSDAACMPGLACVRSYCNCTLAVESDEYRSCGLRVDGSVWCWGDNTNGELGNGTIGGNRAEPAPVMGLPADIVEIDLGAFHACARTGAGALWCWGRFDAESPAPLPYLVQAPPVVEIASGGFHTCVRTETDQVYCMGRNSDGQLGQGSTGDPVPTPVPVPGLEGVKTLAAGGFHTCAVRGDGTVACWGLDDYGQIGDGQAGDGSGRSAEPVPVPVLGLDAAVQVSAGDWYSCARRAGGDVQCWGQNDQGQLGRGGVTQAEPMADLVVDLPGVAQLYAGDDHACAFQDDGTLFCWGSNLEGQLGIAATTPLSERPVRVDVADVVDVSLGRQHTCALTRDGATYCWGRNASGEHGDGTQEPDATPAPGKFACVP